MRPIYSNTKSESDSAYSKTKPIISTYKEEIYETIDEDIYKRDPNPKVWSESATKDYKDLNQTDSLSTKELDYSSIRKGLKAFDSGINSTFLEPNSINITPESANSSSSGNGSSSNIDTTPLFSPSQILKLNRQRAARQSAIEEEKHPEYLRNYQRLSHNKNYKYKNDFNNNNEEVIETHEMSNQHEPLPEPPKELPPIESSPNTNETKQISDASITSATTVFTYKKNTEKIAEPKQELKPEPVVRPVSPIRKTETFTETIKTTNKYTSLNPVLLNKTQNDSRFNSTSSSITKESYTSDIYSPQYRSTISPRHTVISRRNNSDRTTVMTNYNSLNHSLGFTDSPISLRPTSYQNPKSLALKESRQKEKKQLGELNDRFAGYVERVRFLEAQNKKLQMELESLKSKWGCETKQIEQMYKIELEEARAVLNETSKSKDCVQMIVDKQERELENIKRKYNEAEELVNKEKDRANYLQEQISANESEISLLKRRLQDLNDEEKRCKQEAVHMMNEITRVSFELETEMKNRLMLENDKQSLEEELIFLKEVHAKEIEELKQLQFHNQGIDPAVFFKNELSHAIKEIRDEYESLNQTQKSELEGWYRIKISEIQRKTAQKALTAGDEAINREQTRKLKVQISETKRDSAELKAKNADLESRIKDLEEEIRREHEEGKETISAKDNELNLLTQSYKDITNDYEELMVSKTDLESEIRTYRKLLEGEEEKDGLKQIVEGIEKRAKNMSVNKDINQYCTNMNRSYTVDTGYTSGALNNSNTSLKSSFKSNTGLIGLEHNSNKVFSNFAQKFEANYHRTLPNNTKIQTTNKQYYPNHSRSSSTSTTYNLNASLANKSDIDCSSNTSNSSHYSSLFSR